MTDILNRIKADPRIDPAFRDALPAYEGEMRFQPDPLPAAKLEPSPADLDHAATLISLELSRAKENVSKIIDAINANLDKAEMRKSLDAYLSDCAGELVGAINNAAEKLRDDLYGGVSARGPFYRHRGV